MAVPSNYDLMVLPESTLHLPVLTWQTTLPVGKVLWRRWHYIVGAIEPHPEAYLVNVVERIPLSQVTIQNPISNNIKWTLVSPVPVQVIVATIEATMERLVDTILMCGGKIVLVPVPYIPPIAEALEETYPKADEARQLVCY